MKNPQVVDTSLKKKFNWNYISRTLQIVTIRKNWVSKYQPGKSPRHLGIPYNKQSLAFKHSSTASSKTYPLPAIGSFHSRVDRTWMYWGDSSPRCWEGDQCFLIEAPRLIEQGSHYEHQCGFGVFARTTAVVSLNNNIVVGTKVQPGTSIYYPSAFASM